MAILNYFNVYNLYKHAEIEFKVNCSSCNSELTVKKVKYDRWNIPVIKVEPCEKCIQEALSDAV
jgi:hypothetical protein